MPHHSTSTRAWWGSGFGIGTSSTRTSRCPCQRAARIGPSDLLLIDVASVEGRSLGSRFYPRYVPAAQVCRKERAAPKGEVCRVAEEVGLLIPDQPLHLPFRGDAEHLARLVAGDVEVARRVEGQP